MKQKNKLPKDTTVVVAMSGGVDSSVAAALLAEQGYNLIGITIKTYRYEDVGGNIGNDSSCCSLDGINDARGIAAQFGFPHYVLDFSEIFGRTVIDTFADEYLSGRTPNPCVLCNREIKWAELIRKAEALGADYIATGHYARVRYDETRGRYIVSRGYDTSKDQSYALWGLTQHSLSRTLFPLSELPKPKVRELAEKFKLKTAKKGESYEICFIPDNNYERFLKERIPTLEKEVSGGQVLFEGNVVGEHHGFPFYTIGQRKGLEIAVGEKIYVTGIDAKTNTVTMGRVEELLHRKLIASKVNLIAYENLYEPKRVRAKIRYIDKPVFANAFIDAEGKLHVEFEEPKRAITPGQSVVLYEENDIVGGGVIDEVFD
ncbi:MAG: tRNA 2-thiouridine(34) synthase MnmA [Ignavibacteriales bacterium]|nr:tRNA 2-thiouridine(34) synthase MnmA [Ignavibacteriales bacterium]